jgi:integral membrane protein
VTRRYYNFKPFSPEEAWTLYKLAAVGEAVGWSVLITGLILAHFLHSNLPVLIAGQFHGLLFLMYFAATITVSPSIPWDLRKTFLAIAFGVPPYGSLIFELWQSLIRSQGQFSLTVCSRYLSQLPVTD